MAYGNSSMGTWGWGDGMDCLMFSVCLPELKKAGS